MAASSDSKPSPAVQATPDTNCRRCGCNVLKPVTYEFTEGEMCYPCWAEVGPRLLDAVKAAIELWGKVIDPSPAYDALKSVIADAEKGSR